VLEERILGIARSSTAACEMATQSSYPGANIIKDNVFDLKRVAFRGETFSIEIRSK